MMMTIENQKMADNQDMTERELASLTARRNCLQLDIDNVRGDISRIEVQSAFDDGKEQGRSEAEGNNEVQEMYDAALDAVDYVGQANWQNRHNAANAWRDRIRNGKRDLTIEQVDAKLEEEAEARNVVIDDIE